MPKRTTRSKDKRGPPTSAVAIIGDHVYEQAKATRAKAALEALRPDEAPLGSLTSEEQSWLTTAFAHLNQIYENRKVGTPGKEAFCIFEVGKVYVQFLAPSDGEQLFCEAVSAKSLPDIAAILTTEGDAALRKLGFNAPERSPNYSQMLKIEGVQDLAYAARLGFRVLKQVYRVADFGAATFKIDLPKHSMATDQNIGKTCLQTIASIWQVDDSAVKWVDDGFDWSPGSHLVRVRAISNEKSATEERWRISVQTDFLASVPIEDTKFIELVAAQSGLLTSTYSMQYPPAEMWKSNGEKPKLSLFSSVYVDPQLVQWLPRFLAQEALVQVTNAEVQSVPMSEAVGGKPDFLLSGRNKNPDEILGVVSKIYVPEGDKPSRWNGSDEFGKFAGNYGSSDGCFGNGDKSGLTLEAPFGDDSALIRLLPGAKHPQLGSGLLVTIQMPFLAAFEEIAKWSALLNYSEGNRWTDFPQLGCWQPHSSGGSEQQIALAHASFVPNALYAGGLATNLAFWSLARVRWIRQEFWPKLEDKPMSEILKKRFGT